MNEDSNPSNHSIDENTSKGTRADAHVQQEENNNVSADSLLPFNVDVKLSRPTYRVGGTIVGTVRLTPKNEGQQQGGNAVENTTNNNVTDFETTNSTAIVTSASQRIRDSIESLLIFAVGYCRFDPRWHSYDDHLILFDQCYEKGKILVDDNIPVDLPVPPNYTVPVWASHPIFNLMRLPERSVGRWKDSKPKPIRLPQLSNRNQQSQDVENDDLRHLAFTFRIDLPNDIPPTIVTASCRNYYTIVLRIQLKTNYQQDPYSNIVDPFWFHIPVTILTALDTCTTRSDSGDHDVPAGMRISFQAMAHSSGLSCPLTATELHQVDGQYIVNRNGAALYRHLNNAPCNSSIVQSMSVVDPYTGIPVCLLSMIGVSRLHPGSRIVLKFDFPSQRSSKNRTIVEENGRTSKQLWLSCYQVCACLKGEEVAIQLSRSTDTERKTRVARKHLFASAYQQIDPCCVESVSLDLVLPPSAPCTVSTDAVEVSTQCIVDVAIGEESKKKGGIKFRNLHLEIPCYVEHPRAAWECESEADGGMSHKHKNDDLYDQLLAERDLLRQEKAQRVKEQANHECNDNDNHLDISNISYFRSKDIIDDLKILSLTMADQCNIRPKPPSS